MVNRCTFTLLLMRAKNWIYSLLALSLFAWACNTPLAPAEPEGFVEPQPQKVVFANAQFSYMGDDIGEESCDGWVVKFYTDMEIDDYGNPVGAGCVMQLLLNVTYNPEQVVDTSLLAGVYTAQTSAWNFLPNTFVDGYIDYIELPDGRYERGDGTFYADIAEGETAMDIDLLDDGAVEIVANDDGTFTFEGVMVGKKCKKRYFEWRGVVEPTSYVVPEVPNTTLTDNLTLTTLSQMQIQDKGDSFYIKDESYRTYLIFLAEEGVEFSWGKPVGSGRVVRLELLVPWDSKVEEGVPAGEYTFIQRNADTSIDRDKIVPFRAIAGLPNRFTAPYWAGCWYVEYVDGAWGERYGRIDDGTIRVERTESGEHHFECLLLDCSKRAVNVSVNAIVANDKVLIFK